MQTLIRNPSFTTAETERASSLLKISENQIFQRTDRMFAGLMVFQFFAGIVAALVISPKTWIGVTSHTHIHVWAAIFLGGAICGFPVFLAWKRPGHVATRHTIAIAQMLTSALLIHLTGGRIETHFHVFGSLAFLAFYRDWRVLISATVVVAADHFTRGVFWPQSVFGILTPSSWRWLEHAAWVIFEDVFLLLSIQQGREDMSHVAERQARLEAVNETIEQKVRERTRDLQREIQERIETQSKLEETHKQLMLVSRQAGMAEVATGLLHNIGNVLNSVSVSATLLGDRLRHSKFNNLHRATKMLREQNGHLPEFLTTDPKGKLLPEYLGNITDQLALEQTELLTEVSSVSEHIEHIKGIVAMQQSYAKVSGMNENLSPAELVEDALRMNLAAFERHRVCVVREIDETTPKVCVDRHKVLQILINLVRNAKYAMDHQNADDKKLVIRVEPRSSDQVRIIVKDNGLGIAPENLARIFNHGFTTKLDGHGFGLHSGANAAREMGGSLSAHSDGVGKGASFILDLPVAKTEEVFSHS